MRFRNRIRSLDCASNEKHCKFTTDLNLKSVITLLIVNTKQIFQLFFIFILNLWFPLKSTFYLEISRFTFTISGTVCSYLSLVAGSVGPL